MAKWRELTTIEEWEEVYKNSNKPLIVFKHSTACPVSSNALNEFEQYLAGTPREDIDYVLVKVIESRPVSNRIAEDTGVKHESPQIMYIDEKRSVVWNTSHWAITVEHMTAVLH